MDFYNTSSQISLFRDDFDSKGDQMFASTRKVLDPIHDFIRFKKDM